jgi:hypothetical protein
VLLSKPGEDAREGIHACPRKLHPLNLGVSLQNLPQLIGVLFAHPHQPPGVSPEWYKIPAPSSDGLFKELR